VVLKVLFDVYDGISNERSFKVKAKQRKKTLNKTFITSVILAMTWLAI